MQDKGTSMVLFFLHVSSKEQVMMRMTVGGGVTIGPVVSLPGINSKQQHMEE